MMSWKSYIFPQTIARLSSSYNRDIQVIEEYGKLKLLVNGSRQSGEYMKKLWLNAFKAFGVNKNLPINSILVLGIGGGTVIGLLRVLYKDAQITAVDIDPVMIDIGKRYFGLSTLQRLQLIEADANRFITDAVRKKSFFDIIIADISIGRHIPSFVLEDSFLNNLKTLTKPHCFIIINYLREREYQEKSKILLDKLSKIFHSVSSREIFLNKFFFAR